MITDKTIKLAVFGQPVAHSLSPRIHRAFGEQLGIDVDYQAIESGTADLPGKLSAFRDEGGVGANLTLPLKETGLRLCSAVDPTARRARAVNTLKALDDGWHGYNTDGAGLMLDLERLSLPVTGQRILIIGAGGATAGLLDPLLRANPRQVCLLNRTPERAIRLADKFAHRGNIQAGSLETGPGEEAFDLLIQSTSAGHANEELPLRREWLTATASAYDLNYGPAHGPFASWCQHHNLPAHDGLGMLIGQAALAFEIWTGQRPDITPVLDSLRRSSSVR
jgi:shikimate dehydrogenase